MTTRKSDVVVAAAGGGSGVRNAVLSIDNQPAAGCILHTVTWKQAAGV